MCKQFRREDTDMMLLSLVFECICLYVVVERG